MYHNSFILNFGYLTRQNRQGDRNYNYTRFNQNFKRYESGVYEILALGHW